MDILTKIYETLKDIFWDLVGVCVNAKECVCAEILFSRNFILSHTDEI